MADLNSPGVQVSVIDESFYTPATPGTVPLIFVATASNKSNAAKTGTAQSGNTAKNTHTWMIAFAPASHPTVAVAVVVPFQSVSSFGSTIAGPIVKCLVEGALALQKGLPTHGTSTTCLN